MVTLTQKWVQILLTFWIKSEGILLLTNESALKVLIWNPFLFPALSETNCELGRRGGQSNLHRKLRSVCSVGKRILNEKLLWTSFCCIYILRRTKTWKSKPVSGEVECCTDAHRQRSDLHWKHQGETFLLRLHVCFCVLNVVISFSPNHNQPSDDGFLILTCFTCYVLLLTVVLMMCHSREGTEGHHFQVAV